MIILRNVFLFLIYLQQLNISLLVPVYYWSQIPAVRITSVNLSVTGSSCIILFIKSKLAPGIHIICQSVLTNFASILRKFESPIIKTLVLSVNSMLILFLSLIIVFEPILDLLFSSTASTTILIF